jgi:DNA-binding NarL/FixJ family response regulator
MTSVAIVDDHELVADGLRRLVDQSPGLRAAAVVSSGDELLTLLASGADIDVCSIDLSMPGLSGLDLLAVLSSQWPDVGTLVCSASTGPELAARCLRAGAAGFISKFRPGPDYIGAVRQVADGRRYVDPDLVSEVVDLLSVAESDGPAHQRLSERELAVMLGLARGVSIKDLAASLYVSAKTVSTYRSRVLTKMGLRSNAELTAYALGHGLVQLDVGTDPR